MSVEASAGALPARRMAAASGGGAVSVGAPATVNVRPVTDADHGAWNAFVFAEPESTFFHRIEWQDVLTRAFGHCTHYLLAERAGRIVGVLPLGEIKSVFFGHALISTPFCVHGGIVASDPAAFDALERAACELAQSIGVDYLEMRNVARRHHGWPSKDLYVTFRKPISSDPEENMLAIPRKQRAMVRKGIKENLRSVVDPGVDRHYTLYSHSLRNLGTPVFSRRYLEILRQAFGPDCDVVTVLKDDEPVASCLNFYFRDEVLPYYGGGGPRARSIAGNDFMYWEIMERARQRGCRVFDYGRSKQGTGAYDFKRNWGFEPVPLHYEYFMVRRKELPNLSPSNPKYARAIEVWRRIPLAITQLIGPPIAKHLG
jgi:FemAB-related protein (PEP-CTERM system-associated)